MRVGADVRDLANHYDIKAVRTDNRRDEFMVYRFGTIGFGGNSGFQAVNLAVQFGCRTIVLVGYDMHNRNGLHWHGEHGANLNNPTAKSFARWRQAIDAQAAALERMGVRVINASLDSALTAFPKMTLSAALKAAEVSADDAGYADAREEASPC